MTIDTYFDEGFTLVGDGSLTFTFPVWPITGTGTDTTYTFESTLEGFVVTGDCASLYTFAEPMDTGGNC